MWKLTAILYSAVALILPMVAFAIPVLHIVVDTTSRYLEWKEGSSGSSFLEEQKMVGGSNVPRPYLRGSQITLDVEHSASLVEMGAGKANSKWMLTMIVFAVFTLHELYTKFQQKYAKMVVRRALEYGKLFDDEPDEDESGAFHADAYGMAFYPYVTKEREAAMAAHRKKNARPQFQFGGNWIMELVMSPLIAYGVFYKSSPKKYVWYMVAVLALGWAWTTKVISLADLSLQLCCMSSTLDSAVAGFYVAQVGFMVLTISLCLISWMLSGESPKANTVISAEWPEKEEEAPAAVDAATV